METNHKMLKMKVKQKAEGEGLLTCAEGYELRWYCV